MVNEIPVPWSWYDNNFSKQTVELPTDTTMLCYVAFVFRKQKEVNRLEAMELDVEMAMIQNESQAKLQQQVQYNRSHDCTGPVDQG